VILVLCDPSWTGSWRNTLLAYEPDDPFLPAEDVHEDVFFSMSSLCKESESAPPLLMAYIQLALSRTIPLLTLRKNRGALQPDSLHRIIGYISENYHSPLTLDKLSAEMGISRYYLSRTFSEKLQTSFPNYLNSLRVDLAKNLLESGDQDILQICYECGFESQRTFNRVFKNACGITPREYRTQK
jgi:AraC-like DNA-binding protein